MLYVAKLSEDGKAIIRMSIPYTGLFRYMIVVLPLLLVGMMVAFCCKRCSCSEIFRIYPL